VDGVVGDAVPSAGVSAAGAVAAGVLVAVVPPVGSAAMADGAPASIRRIATAAPRVLRVTGTGSLSSAYGVS
jgi:hypothetical protein